MTTAEIAQLHEYSACDVSDALLKVQKSGKVTCQQRVAGYLFDIEPLAGKQIRDGKPSKIIAPAFTVQFQPNNIHKQGEDCGPKESESNIPSGVQWSDLVQPHTVVVIQQPDDQKCAVLGGIHALNIVRRGSEAIVVSGRVRDRSELNKLNTQVWARGTSTVGTGAEAKAYATQVCIKAGEMYIEPGDIVFCDPDEGVVAIPRDMVVEVLNYLSAHVKTEEKIKEDVSRGMSVTDAFAKWR